MSTTQKDSSIVAANHTIGSDALPSSNSASGDISPVHGEAEILRSGDPTTRDGGFDTATQPQRKRVQFGYLTTKDFWLVLALGQILALSLTGTNTLTTLLVIEGTSIPAFQTFFNYVLLNLIYTSFTLYKYGFQGWARLIWKDGWKCKCFLNSC